MLFTFELLISVMNLSIRFTEYNEYVMVIVAFQFCVEICALCSILVLSLKLANFCSLPFPKDFDEQWFTTMFQEQNFMRPGNIVNNVSGGKKLTGGCHSAVCKVNINYRQNTSWLPNSVIVKILSWDKPLSTKMKLATMKYFPRCWRTKEYSYLKSYTIESKFYEEIAPEVHGILVPRVYYNYGDSFNHQFGMVMEDVTHREPGEPLSITGQPHGFTFEDTCDIISQLARFHAWFWDHPDLQNYNIWNVAGYYTGSKRIQFKNKVEEHWKSVMDNLGKEMNIQKYSSFGSRLYKNREALNTIYKSEKLKTLVHGDYKISNIFIDRRKTSQLKSRVPVQRGDEQTTSAIHVIDWQWVGRGTGAVDVAYYFATSTTIDTLNRSSMKKLVKKYHLILVAKGVKNYTFKEMWIDFRLSFIDFIVYVICCKWSTMKVCDFKKNQEQQKDGLHIRSLEHAEKLVKLANTFMDGLEFDS